MNKEWIRFHRGNLLIIEGVIIIIGSGLYNGDFINMAGLILGVIVFSIGNIWANNAEKELKRK